jgi:Protein of unknown function (DUF3987)
MRVDDTLRFAVLAVRKLRAGELIEPGACTHEHFGDNWPLIEEMRVACVAANAGTESEVGILADMEDFWTAARLDKRYRALVDAVDSLDLEEMAGNGQPADDPTLISFNSFISYSSAANNGGDNSLNSFNSSPHTEKYSWPVLDQAHALIGPAGALTAAIDEYTEADPVAVLINILTAFGNVVGHGPHFEVEYTKHPLRLFAVLVGDSAKGRKGLSWSTPRHLFRAIEEAWVDGCVTSGLSSGEGLIYHVRDERREKQPVKQKGRVIDYEEVVIDAGVSDKRLLVIEEEFAQALKVMRREGNILSPVLRAAWDTGHLHPLTKSNPVRATDAHISVIGHITKDELLRHLDSTEQANGFANRFLWVLVRRSKEIAEPMGIPEHRLNPLIIKFQAAVSAARQIGRMVRDEEAGALWRSIYSELSASKPGLLGHIIARAEAQVMRLACLYAALDRTCFVSKAHLEAGLAVWRYCEASARYIFGDATGDPLADEIMRLLRASPQGLTRTEVSDRFGRNKPAHELTRALNKLRELKMAACREEESGGRKAERWCALV